MGISRTSQDALGRKDYGTEAAFQPTLSKSQSMEFGATTTSNFATSEGMERLRFPVFQDKALEAAFVAQVTNPRVLHSSYILYWCVTPAWAAYLGMKGLQLFRARNGQIDSDFAVFIILQIMFGIVCHGYIVIHYLKVRDYFAEAIHMMLGTSLACICIWMHPWKIGYFTVGNPCSLYQIAGTCPGADTGDTLLLLAIQAMLAFAVCGGSRCRSTAPVTVGLPLFYLLSEMPQGWSGHSRTSIILHTVFIFFINVFLWIMSRTREKLDRKIWLSERQLSAEISDMNARTKESPENVALTNLASAIRRGDSDEIESASACLMEFGWTTEMVDEEIKDVRRHQSETFGVSVAYLLSDEFTEMSQKVTGSVNPSFYEISDAIFQGEDALGRNVICPRDGELGCSLLDLLPPCHRNTCTHFLSWTWGYRLLMLQGALQRWLVSVELAPSEVYLWMCFFVNNQHRVLNLNSKSKESSDDLDQVFEANLLNIGKMVAVLESWQDPCYLKRIWCIFEQYTATRLGIEVTMVLPPEAVSSLLAEVDQGKRGILKVRESLSNVDSASAKASVSADEDKVKALITQSVGFHEVNAAIVRSLIKWIGLEIQQYMAELTMGRGEAGLKRRLSMFSVDGLVKDDCQIEVSSSATSEFSDTRFSISRRFQL